MLDDVSGPGHIYRALTTPLQFEFLRRPVMRTFARSLRTCVLLATIAVPGTTALDAQGVTTAAIAGVVTDSAGAPLEGARVVAVHGPSGTTYAAVTRVDGRFTIPGMRVGGPYKVSASRVGYRQEVQNGVTVSLGVTSDLQFRLPQATVQLEAVTVETSAAGSLFSSH